ncbi:MAG: DUF6371 domain-containing protein [Bacteroidales bacterium]|nr:DUF6371 domain-containing protein [Bacteroidales bacterium]
MADPHNYSLQRYSGPGSRFTCPACGEKHCFTLYVDESGDYLNEAVGRCNHESSCGYHYTPRQFFEDHPSARPDWKENFFRVPQPVVKNTVKKQLWTITTDIVKSTVNPAIDSDFTMFLTGLIGKENTVNIVKEYHIGVTKKRDVIFYQVDTEGRCRTGKIMKYDRKTGHRVKDEQVGGKITWVHAVLRQSADPLLRLPDGWELTQCLFGEHLLRQHPTRPVALVESEKTAVICSAFWPQYIWLATGGKSQLNDRLQVLMGRKVVAFPDVDGYLEWKEKLSRVSGLDIVVSDVLEKEASFEDRARHVDIADLLIRQHWKEHMAITPVEKYEDPRMHPTFLKLKGLVGGCDLEELDNMKGLADVGYWKELALLVNELDLEVEGVREV